jgi:hypothetical protein
MYVTMGEVDTRGAGFVARLAAMAMSLSVAGCGDADDGMEPFVGSGPPVADGSGGDDDAGDDGVDDGSGGAADDGVDDGGDDGPPPSGECDLGMDVAIRVTVNVSWEGGLAVVAGGGAINVWLLGTLDPVSGGVHLTGSMWRLQLPDFQTGAIAGGETYGTEFPDSAWSSPTLPTIDAVATLSSADPGATLHLAEGGVVLGANMGDPLNDPWPAEWSGLMTADHDGDGSPGITAYAKVGGNYAYPRIDILNSDARAEALYIASRTIMEFDGVISSCDEAGGDVSMTMENHAVGCKIAGGSGECTGGQTGTLDNNMPVFQVQTGVFQLRRIADGGTCSDVFAALP